MARAYLEDIYPNTRMRYPIAGLRPEPMTPSAAHRALAGLRRRALELGVPAPLVAHVTRALRGF